MGNDTPRTAFIDQGGNNFGYLSGLAPATIYWDNFDVREIHVTTGGDGDTIQVLRSSERMFFSNSGGLDHLSIGNSATGIDQITAAVDVGPNAAAAYTDLTIIDTGGTVGRNIRWVPSGSGFFLLGLPIGIRYENVSQLNVLGGSGNDRLTVSNANQTLDNLPLVGFAGGGGVDQIIFDDSGFNGSDLYRIDDTSYYFGNGNVLAGTFQADVESFWLKTGAGNDAVNFAITPNDLTFRNYMVTPSGGINAINIDDTRSSAAFQLDVQSAPSFGYVTMAERTADLNFSNVQIVNLYKTPGSPVELSFYNPADFRLNIFEGATHGDFNDDGRWNVRDLDALVARIATGAFEDSYDLNRDGQLNFLDRDLWLAEAGGVNLGFGLVYRLGDANLDGYVDGLDFTIWNSHKFTANFDWSSGNFNADVFVDGVDFTIWNSHKFTSSFGARYNIDFTGLPGTDDIPGIPDDIPIGPGDFGSHIIQNKYAPAGVTFAGMPTPNQIGGGYNPDGTPNTGNIVVLNSWNPTPGLEPLSIHFARPQGNVTFDLLAYLNVSGTSVPVTLWANGTVNGTQLLTTSNAIIGGTNRTPLSGRFQFRDRSPGEYCGIPRRSSNSVESTTLSTDTHQIELIQ